MSASRGLGHLGRAVTSGDEQYLGLFVLRDDEAGETFIRYQFVFGLPSTFCFLVSYILVGILIF